MGSDWKEVQQEVQQSLSALGILLFLGGKETRPSVQPLLFHGLGMQPEMFFHSCPAHRMLRHPKLGFRPEPGNGGRPAMKVDTCHVGTSIPCARPV